MDKELYKQNTYWEEEYQIHGYIREKYLNWLFDNINTKEILFLTGLRRVGKTTIMKHFIKKLLDSGVKSENILFVNLDTFTLIDKTIHDIIEEYRKIHKKSVKENFYLFLDEVTSKDNFELELKSIYDNENIKIIASSSTASLMRDKKAYLTGRTKTKEIMPLSFSEFLLFNNVIVKKYDKAKLEGYFREYLETGGIPYYVLSKDKEYLNELVESIIYKDIISHYNITNQKVIKELFVLICERVGKVTSYNKLANILGISVDSVKRYIDYFEKSFLFYSIERYSKSYNENITSPKKFYIGDVGIKNMVTGFRDIGASYENLVFLKIKNKKPKYFFDNGCELDFMMDNEVIEAKYNMELTDKQKKVFDNIIKEKKIIAKGVDYFISFQDYPIH